MNINVDVEVPMNYVFKVVRNPKYAEDSSDYPYLLKLEPTEEGRVFERGVWAADVIIEAKLEVKCHYLVREYKMWQVQQMVDEHGGFTIASPRGRF